MHKIIVDYRDTYCIVICFGQQYPILTTTTSQIFLTNTEQQQDKHEGSYDKDKLYQHLTPSL